MKTYIGTITFNEPLNTDVELIGNMLSSDHEPCCCEWHELDFDSFKQDFNIVKDILSQIDKMEIYWEEGMGITFYFYDGEKRAGIFVPWRWDNNWYYSDNLTLIVDTPDGRYFEYDIREYQDTY